MRREGNHPSSFRNDHPSFGPDYPPSGSDYRHVLYSPVHHHSLESETSIYTGQFFMILNQNSQNN